MKLTGPGSSSCPASEVNLKDALLKGEDREAVGRGGEKRKEGGREGRGERNEEESRGERRGEGKGERGGEGGEERRGGEGREGEGRGGERRRKKVGKERRKTKEKERKEGRGELTRSAPNQTSQRPPITCPAPVPERPSKPLSDLAGAYRGTPPWAQHPLPAGW